MFMVEDLVTHKFPTEILRDPTSLVMVRFAHIMTSLRLSSPPTQPN